mmetsp:Transcript_20794/g.29161  ORF Transcript_20794/g.29161 Transcript_20794/m.29161 type:complete len:120 (-) Transcript_20794:89-448(-)
MQRQGIGSELVKAGLAACMSEGVDLVFVLGSPGYYGRFGFEDAKLHGFRWEKDGPDVHEGAFQCVELNPGSMKGSRFAACVAKVPHSSRPIRAEIEGRVVESFENHMIVKLCKEFDSSP